MKISLVLFLFCSSFGFSQIWVKNNATWMFSYHYNQYGDPFELEEHFGYMKVQHVGDTLIQNKLCKKFETIQYRFTGNPNDLGVLESITHLENNYTYVNEDTVFFLQNNQFQVLYNFDLQIGDPLAIHFSGSQTGMCNDTSFTYILNLGIETIQGNNYRFIENLGDINSENYWYQLNGKISERFGPYTGFLFPNYTASCSVSGIQLYDYTVLCFRDDEFEIDFSGNNLCPSYFLLAMEEKWHNQKIQIQPNPVSDILTIKGELNQCELIVHDFTGKIIVHVKASPTLDLSEFENGIYFVQFLIDDREIQVKKIIKN